jgi:hypothetical protein
VERDGALTVRWLVFWRTQETPIEIPFACRLVSALSAVVGFSGGVTGSGMCLAFQVCISICICGRDLMLLGVYHWREKTWL